MHLKILYQTISSKTPVSDKKYKTILTKSSRNANRQCDQHPNLKGYNTKSTNNTATK